jgi:hypothetical protein
MSGAFEVVREGGVSLSQVEGLPLEGFNQPKQLDVGQPHQCRNRFESPSWALTTTTATP